MATVVLTIVALEAAVGLGERDSLIVDKSARLADRATDTGELHVSRLEKRRLEQSPPVGEMRT